MSFVLRGPDGKEYKIDGRILDQMAWKHEIEVEHKKLDEEIKAMASQLTTGSGRPALRSHPVTADPAFMQAYRETLTAAMENAASEANLAAIAAEAALRRLAESQALDAPPPWGERILCLAVPLDAQDEKLGDMRERFAKTWVPRFGSRGAKVVYFWHVLWLGQRLWRSALFCAAADWFVRKIGL